MPISFSNYVAITSSVGGVAQASARDLILRLFTDSARVPTGSVIEFTTLEAVADYFTTTSVEYLQAAFYFGFISKLSTTPDKISYAHWADAATVPRVHGIQQPYDLADFTAISDGSMSVTLGAITEDITGINLTGAASLADVATLVEAAIQAANVDTQFASCAVVFSASVSRFDLAGGGPSGPAVMDITPGTGGTPLAPVIGWTQPGAMFSDGAAAQTVTTVLTDSTQTSNNFGSYAFIPPVTEAQITESATWNDGQNIKFMYLEKVLDTEAQDVYDAINTFSGTALTLYDDTLSPLEYPWIAPGSVLAATPYNRRASVQNYMFQQFSLTASVTTNSLSAFYDGIRVNYYGNTQQAGALISFYQRGFLMGGSNDPIDMGVYANEEYLKDAVGVSIINLLLALPVVPANASGKAQVLAAIQSDIEDALFSGIISIGKTLNQTQVAYITSVTGDPNAFLTIQNAGYWIDAVIVDTGGSNFEVQYTLLYSKNDAIRKVVGSHTLI